MKVKGLVTLLTTLFVTCIIYSAAFAANLGIAQVAEETNACGKKMTADMKAQRALDIAEIINIAGMHEYYHSALMHKEELENIWSLKRDDISWKNNSQYFANKKDVYKFYADGVPTGEQKRGALWYHMLCTPVVVVSGDGQTAQAVWQSFGNVSGTNMLQWTEEKYAMDFIKEDGKWKIWHLRTYVEFYTNADSSNTKLWASQNLAAPEGASNAGMPGGFTTPAAVAAQQGQGGQGGAGAPPGGGQGGAGAPPGGGQGGAGAPPGGQGGGGGGDMGQPTETGNYYEGYSEKYMPIFKPVPPSPYCTWEDTTDYNKQE